MNPYLQDLHPYPFQKLSQLMTKVTPPTDREPIMLSIGEPKHAAPEFVKQALQGALDDLEKYPSTRGDASLRETIAWWLEKRFKLPTIDPETHILPVAGTREALFAFTQALIDSSVVNKPLVACPNPFYQIYEGAAILAGAEPYYLNCTADNGFKADLNAVPAHIWERCQLLQLCSPGNPSGAILSLDDYKLALALADKYDFIIAND